MYGLRTSSKYTCTIHLLPAPLGTNSLQALYRVRDTLLERDPFDAQDVGGLRVVVTGEAGLGVVAALGFLGRQLVLKLGEVLADSSDELAVAEFASKHEKALTAGLGLLHGLYVGEGDIAHVDPEMHATGRDLVAHLALHHIHETRVGRVDGLQRVEVVDDGAEDERRADGGEIEVGLLVLDKVPAGPLGQCLGHAVRRRLTFLESVLVSARVPVGFAEHLLGILQARIREDGGEGAGDDHALDTGGILFDGFEDRGCAKDGRVKQLRLGIGPVEVERRGSCFVVNVSRIMSCGMNPAHCG